MPHEKRAEHDGRGQVDEPGHAGEPGQQRHDAEQDRVAIIFRMKKADINKLLELPGII
jgi:hypothetical protein